ncbi:MAG TPA: aldose 1-epimerase family protein [Segeticoccus sp.]|uniref:aldose 1-epimerase family protein n=1 Tax=Segeticoccus sp. TaxID=2706531 RepID=UPI002D7FD1E7|nr:aldose 1-epimerase family protein [Segeticoccus sp.]HET8600545.1 aldose 1-epimerase family protein [Segeticoccus sp.]
MESETYRPSGEQWTIRHGGHEAVVVEVGGGLRSYTVDGRPVLFGYGEGEQASGGRGQLLMPWPNRVRDGQYDFGTGGSLQLALSEPAKHNAIHGLVRWSIWRAARQRDDSVTVACRLRPQQGWSWALDLSVTYALGDEGLTVTPSARNVGMTAAPFGFGAHPYLTAGESHVDQLRLTVPAATSLTVDDQSIPVGRAGVEGTDRDWRAGGVIGKAVIDTGFTDLTAGADGRWRVRVENPDTGAATSLWADAAAFPFTQVFTGDTLSEDLRRTSGVAVEPMSCPANALVSGEGLVVIEPGGSWSGEWGVTPR